MNANMIYLEAPIGVGFSYGSTEDMKVINDNTTSSDNRDALKNFFTKFPNYLANGLYISGESYAGIYVPTLIAKIVDDPMLSPAYKGFKNYSYLFWLGTSKVTKEFPKNKEEILKFYKIFAYNYLDKKSMILSRFFFFNNINTAVRFKISEFGALGDFDHL